MRLRIATGGATLCASVLALAAIPASAGPPGRDGVAVGPGVWETSGVIDTAAIYGRDTWLMDVQAHSPTAAPAPNTVEDGQLVLMRPPQSG